jgi:hypothetical protein
MSSLLIRCCCLQNLMETATGIKLENFATFPKSVGTNSSNAEKVNIQVCAAKISS